MDKVKDQIKVLETMLTNMEVRRNLDEEKKEELLSIIATLLGLINEGVYEWFGDAEKETAKND